MNHEIFPNTYEEWQRCITISCGIPLTRDYVEARIKVLSNANSAETKVFTAKYGEEWTHTVLGYFQQALKML